MAKRLRKKSTLDGNSQVLVMDINKPEKFIMPVIPGTEQQKKRPSRWWWVLGISSILLLLLIGLSLNIWWYITSFERSSGVPVIQIIDSIRTGARLQPFSSKGALNVVVLGMDYVKNRGDSTTLSDTIIVLNIHRDGKVVMVSIPRDLWIASLETKVNALYTLGQLQDPPSGAILVKNTLSEITGLPIDYVLVTHLDSIKSVVDALGGIDMTVPRGFTDEEYPRDNVDITSKDPKVLYETVTFTAGNQHFDGDTVIKYIRSRHSADLTEGTDVARTIRQQAVITAIVQTALKKPIITDPVLAGKLYKIWKSTVISEMSDAVVISIGRQLIRQKLTLDTIPIPITDSTTVGLIRINPKNQAGLWVYEPEDPTYKVFHDYFGNMMR